MKVVLAATLAVSVVGIRTRRARDGIYEHRRTKTRDLKQFDHWAIVMEPGTSDEKIQEVCQGKCSAMGHPSKGGVAFAEFNGCRTEVMNLLKGHEDTVQFIEGEEEEQAVPDDIKSETDSPSWGLDRINIKGRKTHGKGVNIYMLDTGIMTTHEDFGGRAVATLDTTQGTQRECKASDTDCAVDVNGHGTHTAATAGGNTYGVADEATLHGVKVVTDGGRGFQSWVYLGLDWVTANGARPAVASVSLQYNGESWGMETSVKAATQASVTVIVAAGNVNNWSCDFSPAYIPEAITVGATTQEDAKASWSNFGDCNDIWAPGQDITSASVDGVSASTTWSGTSMAAPHVSGAAALLLEEDPTLNAQLILESLTQVGLSGVVQGLKPNDPDVLLQVG